jgi:hypothetical protein
MAVQEKVADEAGVREIRVAVPDVGFDEIVALLRKVWTVPTAPGVGGCDPCRSGLDRFVIEDPAFRNFGR